ncbi:unnamed protein product [Periconia digitata]|uniref:Uncharacterized protein n=1 Tax=Periconia digitata TaxID=1303443 RepID=A0A9W4UI54_9PLEO|nr:unnamed protein product [Periconia digitata]
MFAAAYILPCTLYCTSRRLFAAAMIELSLRQTVFAATLVVLVVLLSSIHVWNSFPEKWSQKSRWGWTAALATLVAGFFVGLGVTVQCLPDSALLPLLVLSGLFGLVAECSQFTPLLKGYFPYSVLICLPVLVAQVSGAALSHLDAHHEKAILIAHAGSSLFHISGAALFTYARTTGKKWKRAEWKNGIMLPFAYIGISIADGLLFLLHRNAVWLALGHTTCISILLFSLPGIQRLEQYRKRDKFSHLSSSGDIYAENRLPLHIRITTDVYTYVEHGPTTPPNPDQTDYGMFTRKHIRILMILCSSWCTYLGISSVNGEKE